MTASRDAHDPSAPAALPRAALTCHALEHGGAGTRTRVCGGFLGHVPGAVEFVETARRAPEAPDGDVWLRCVRRRCRIWNRFRLVPMGAAPALPTAGTHRRPSVRHASPDPV